jgi:hypothetical protein
LSEKIVDMAKYGGFKSKVDVKAKKKKKKKKGK